MPDMLLMATLKVSDPIQVFVLVKSDNFSQLPFGLALRLHTALPELMA